MMQDKEMVNDALSMVKSSPKFVIIYGKKTIKWAVFRMAKAWLELYAQFTDLSEEDKRQLFEAIKNDVNAEPRKVIGLYEGIREVRFRKGLACVHCG